MRELRLIVDPPAVGAWNMAVDDALLEQAAAHGIATLRFYEWSEPTLSLGYFQRYDDRHEHQASLGCAIVRRQSGGGAILHDRELTYSVALPVNHPLAHDPSQLYRGVHAAVIDEVQPRLDSLSGRWLLEICEAEESPASGEPFLCFERRAAGDLLLAFGNTGDSAGRTVGPRIPTVKILGSAQRRRQGAVLQHGSLLLAQSPAAPELPGLRDRSGLSLSASQLASNLAERLANLLEMTAVAWPCGNTIEPLAESMVREKYGSLAWTKRR